MPGPSLDEMLQRGYYRCVCMCVRVQVLRASSQAVSGWPVCMCGYVEGILSPWTSAVSGQPVCMCVSVCVCVEGTFSPWTSAVSGWPLAGSAFGRGERGRQGC